MEKFLNIVKSKWFFLGVGLLLGALTILVIRYFTYTPEAVHYHANFAAYIDGQREEFKGLQYYEEFTSASCNTAEHQKSPNERAHMHSNINDVVHVHDNLVTWGNFFQYLGWNVGDTFLATPNKIYQNTDKAELSFILNGKHTDSIVNRVIQDRDRLLISYGINNETSLNEQFNSVSSSAKEYDESKDTAACGANIKPTYKDRLNHLF